MVIKAGTRLGRSEVRSLLGTGGVGEVYEGFDTANRRPVIIKILPRGFTNKFFEVLEADKIVSYKPRRVREQLRAALEGPISRIEFSIFTVMGSQRR